MTLSLSASLESKISAKYTYTLGGMGQQLLPIPELSYSSYGINIVFTDLVKTNNYLTGSIGINACLGSSTCSKTINFLTLTSANSINFPPCPTAAAASGKTWIILGAVGGACGRINVALAASASGD